MNKDLHTYLDNLEGDFPGDVIRVKKEVDPEFEIPVILQKIELKKREPVIIFERVRNLKGEVSIFPVIINLFASRQRLAYALNSNVQSLHTDYANREKPVLPIELEKKNARVKEVILDADTVDLFELPIITHNEMDLGPYITAGSVWVKDPETQWVNCAILRIFVAGPKRLLVNFNPARHTHHIFTKYEKMGSPMPSAIIIGHHPAFYMGAQTKLLTNEPDIIGGIMGEPLELTPSETWGSDLLVPANADLIIEAEISSTDLDIEAPFGEFTQYYGGQRLNPVAEVTAVTHRKDAFYLDIMPGHADHLLLDAPMIEAYLYSRLKAVVPGTIAVRMPMSGTARLHAYIKIKKRNDAEPKTAIATALSSDFRVKHAIVVDDDVDIDDEEQVLWAVATRSQWDKDLMVLHGMMGTRLDPSADGITTVKGGIDATKPYNSRSFPVRLSMPSHVMERIKLEDFLDSKDLEQL
ncbi:MAG: UbiD family decarboxylase [Desulfobacteraceae bacterium]|nr:UbiD family decarboxylase [Desulfobacteraceae bacterium]